jgi:hypothetical protein
MNRYPDPRTLAAHWQRTIEINSEAGRRPLIGLGMNSFQPESVLRSLAIQRLARRPAGVMDPLIVVGGEGEEWLLTVLQWQVRRGQPLQPASFAITYGGSDLATHAAILNVHTAPGPDPGGPFLPHGMAWMLSPTALPGSEHSDLEALPFLLADPLFAPVAVPPVTAHWLDQLETWVVLLFVASLLLAAWFL